MSKFALQLVDDTELIKLDVEEFEEARHEAYLLSVRVGKGVVIRETFVGDAYVVVDRLDAPEA